jgi:hypothetical protein
MTQSHILGIATQFPELQNTVESTEAFFKKWAKPSEGQVHADGTPSLYRLCFCSYSCPKYQHDVLITRPYPAQPGKDPQDQPLDPYPHPSLRIRPDLSLAQRTSSTDDQRGQQGVHAGRRQARGTGRGEGSGGLGWEEGEYHAFG